jgi:hypothetical protein
MPSQQSKGQKGTIERVMHEFKKGELRIRGDGPKVKNRRQAIAIALHEAGSTNQESPAKNKSTLRKTKAKEARGETAEAEKEGKRAQDRTLAKGAAQAKGGTQARGGTQAKGQARAAGSRSAKAEPGGSETKAELYAQAKRRDIPGRSRMGKDELRKALGH